MILDSSALVAIVLDEPERESMLAKIAAADMVAVAAPTLLEAGIVLSARLGFDALDILRGILQAADAVTIEFGGAHWPVALDAWARFGRGRHPAGLNFGDCISYATAVVASQPLLAKADGFGKTDVALA